MNLSKWNPVAELEDFSRRLNRIFGRTPVHAESSHNLLAIADWSPSTDISKTETSYLIKADIPGVIKEDVKIYIQDGILNVTLAKSTKMTRAIDVAVT